MKKAAKAIKSIPLKTPKVKLAPTLEAMIDRQLHRVERLTKEQRKASARLQRARVRYSVLKQMASEAGRRSIGAGA